jgi:pimeloyl-ACP methyl ester carboxylesterase
MGTKGSDNALILAPKIPVRQNSMYEDHETLDALFQEGKVPGTFPDQHMVRNVRRFARFSSASYGSNFLRVMGLTSSQLNRSTVLQTQDVHHEHHSFSTHTGLPADTILLSSFVDPQGVGSANSISPLVHFVSIDRDSRAVVLTCRGTLGFEDVLTDMLCDYDDVYWQGQAYQVHKGIHGSARRLLAGLGSRVMATLKAALEEYPDYGLVLCGHSLGGAVASVLAILLSEPSSIQASGAMFVTAPSLKLISHPNHQTSPSPAPPVTLPAGRPIHVYAYGTPATLSSPLRLATRGLITTIVNSADIVPSLSLGMLHDFRSVALSLKTDTTGAINALKTRVWQRITHALQNVFYVERGPPPPEHIGGDGLGEDTWAWSALKTLRAGMHHQKLVPPGEIFVVETTRVFDRQTASSAAAVPDSATERVFRSLGRPATRVQLKLIRDVEARFGELRFGSSMFSDHSPGRYEASLAALEKGVLEC